MKTADTKDDYTSDFAGYSRDEVQIGSDNSEIVLVKETSNGEYRLKDLDTKNSQHCYGRQLLPAAERRGPDQPD